MIPKPRNINSYSLFWRSLHSCRESFHKGYCIIINNGLNRKTWLDPWIPYNQNFKPLPTNNNVVVYHNLNVADVFKNNSWNIDILTNSFDINTINSILKISLPSLPQEDRISWIKNKSGDQLVKGFYFSN